MTLHNVNHCYCFTTLRVYNGAMMTQISKSCPSFAIDSYDSNMTDDSLSQELSPENHAQGGQTTALDIVLDTDHLDYSVLGNVDPGLNIVLDNNSIHCRYFT